jgi:hypothetical protein
VSIRAIQGSLGIFLAIGLAVAGVGWHTELQPRPLEPKLVYVNIAELEQYHPAWGRITEIRELTSGMRRVQDAKLPDVGIKGEAVSSVNPEIGPITRSRLEHSLDSRTEEELSKLSDQLSASMNRQLAEKRQELEVQADAANADEARRSEQTVAKELRTLNESSRDERVAAAVKLAALRSQMSVLVVNHDQLGADIANREKELTSLSNEEDLIRQKAASELADSRLRHAEAITKELSDLKVEESARVESIIRLRRERLLKDISGKDMSPVQADAVLPSPQTAVAQKASISARPINPMVSLGQMPRKDVLAEQMSLRGRIDAELRAVVSRIAHENGYMVTFTPDAKVMDKTSWFRVRLPYPSAARSG